MCYGWSLNLDNRTGPSADLAKRKGRMPRRSLSPRDGAKGERQPVQGVVCVAIIGTIFAYRDVGRM